MKRTLRAAGERVSCAQFVAAVKSCGGQTVEPLLGAFELFAGGDSITLKDLHRVASELGEETSQRELEEMFALASSDGLCVTRSDFEAVIRRGW